jgi:hypothetical protein
MKNSKSQVFVPDSPCYVCGEKIKDNEGMVAADSFGYSLGYLVHKYNDSNPDLLASKDADFTNAVTIQYFWQFPKTFKNPFYKEKKDQGGGLYGSQGKLSKQSFI